MLAAIKAKIDREKQKQMEEAKKTQSGYNNSEAIGSMNARAARSARSARVSADSRVNFKEVNDARMPRSTRSASSSLDKTNKKSAKRSIFSLNETETFPTDRNSNKINKNNMDDNKYFVLIKKLLKESNIMSNINELNDLTRKTFITDIYNKFLNGIYNKEFETNNKAKLIILYVLIQNIMNPKKFVDILNSITNEDIKQNISKLELEIKSYKDFYNYIVNKCKEKETTDADNEFDKLNDSQAESSAPASSKPASSKPASSKPVPEPEPESTADNTNMKDGEQYFHSLIVKYLKFTNIYDKYILAVITDESLFDELRTAYNNIITEYSDFKTNARLNIFIFLILYLYLNKNETEFKTVLSSLNLEKYESIIEKNSYPTKINSYKKFFRSIAFIFKKIKEDDLTEALKNLPNDVSDVKSSSAPLSKQKSINKSLNLKPPVNRPKLVRTQSVHNNNEHNRENNKPVNTNNNDDTKLTNLINEYKLHISQVIDQSTKFKDLFLAFNNLKIMFINNFLIQKTEWSSSSETEEIADNLNLLLELIDENSEKNITIGQKKNLIKYIYKMIDYHLSKVDKKNAFKYYKKILDKQHIISRLIDTNVGGSLKNKTNKNIKYKKSKTRKM